MAETRILFAFFTEPNFEWIQKFHARISRIAKVDFIPGYDFEVDRGRRDKWNLVNPNFSSLLVSAEHALKGGRSTLPETKFFGEELDATRLQALAVKVGVYRKALIEYLQWHPADILIIPEDTDYARGRVATWVARQLGIPTLAFFPLYYCIFESHPMVCSPEADSYMVLNEAVGSALAARGVSWDRIDIVGNPELAPDIRSDIVGNRELTPIAIQYDTTRKRELSATRAQPTTPAVYYLQGDSFEPQIVKALATRLERHGVELWLKPHPRVPYVPWARNIPGVKTLEATNSFESVCERTSLALGQTSGALFRTLARGKPAFFLHFRAGPPPLRHCDGIRELCLTRPAEIDSAILRWKSGALKWDPKTLLGATADPLAKALSVLESRVSRI